MTQLPSLHIIHNTRFWTENPILRLFLVNTGFRGNILTSHCIITLQTLYSFPKERIFIQSFQIHVIGFWILVDLNENSMYTTIVYIHS